MRQSSGGPSPAPTPRERGGPGRWGTSGGPPWQRWLAHTPSARSYPWRSALFVLVFQQVGSGFAAEGQRGESERLGLDVFARGLLTVGPLLLLFRHRFPRLAVFGASAAALVYLGAGYVYGPVLLSVVVAAFSAIVAGHRYAAWGALGALWAGHSALIHVLYRWLPPDGDAPGTNDWGSDLFMLAWIVAVCSAAELARVRRAEWARQRREAEEAERRRADEERLRIARELHDVLAHSISVINVQAGVGLALLDSDPDQARTALTTIKSASKEALGEVRQVLDTLRAPGDAPRAPAPGLDRLPELAEQAAGAGLRVTTGTEGAAQPLPPGADLAAFRVVQEALTNTVRHSGSRTARVLLRYGAHELELRVDDDGPATGDGPTGGGNGLVGMRERAAAFGGTVEAGPRDDGGFTVRARIPLRPPAEPHEADGPPLQ
ncbi:sensor histidine kinase [Streptomyces sp. NPDC048172]|uniref:sensor histidine kinase n=1 Tax=Streptomyces sp. NPDC048172 TaxID=3365505 RepID=UPI0037199457